jgi:ankyrin repeat protein
MIRKLLECNKIEPKVQGAFRKLSLPHICALLPGNGGEEKLHCLFESGKICLDLPDNTGNTPLALAAAQGKGGMVRALLKSGRVSVNHKDTSGFTPLLMAV